MPFIFIIGGGGGDMKKENLTSQVNSVRSNFTTDGEFKANSLRVYYNGLRQVLGEQFSETSDNTFSTTFVPQNGAYLQVEYVQQE